MLAAHYNALAATTPFLGFGVLRTSPWTGEIEARNTALSKLLCKLTLTLRKLVELTMKLL